MPTFTRCEVFKRTSDDWYPSYKMGSGDMLVRVKLTTTGPTPPVNGKWRVCVWGNDDCGMERDFTDKGEAQCCFLEVIKLANVTRAALDERKFVLA